MPTKRRSRGTGTTRQLASGRWQARFRGPDGILRPAGQTFDTKLDATAWLRGQASDVERGIWAVPEVTEYGPQPLLRHYANQWLVDRDLTPKTRLLYRKLLDAHILPALGDARIDRITPSTVRTWYATLNRATPTRRAHAYSLLRTILSTAFREDKIPSNPCRIEGAGQSPKKREEVKPASLDELVALSEAMPERLRLLVLLAAWCGLRFGELTELRRRDVDVDNGVVRVRRGVTYVPGAVPRSPDYIVGAPKSEAGRRAVGVPPHVMPAVKEHLAAHTAPEPDALLFPSVGGRHMPHSTFRQRYWYPARAAAGRDDLRLHDLRHTGAVLAALTGATLADLMHRLGHSTPGAAMRYQHIAEGRDAQIAVLLSELATERSALTKTGATAGDGT